ncbi:hypothetical protein LLG95_16080 [bacterium]|nr:hypothetical protein [bacterium]
MNLSTHRLPRPWAILLALFWAVLTIPAHAQTPAGSTGTVTMTPISEGGQNYVVMQDFLAAIQHFDPQASGTYDPGQQMLRLRAGGKQIDILRGPNIVVDRRLESADRGLILRQGKVLIPEPTVIRVFGLLNVDVSRDGKGAAATPAPPAAIPPQARPSLPTVPINALGATTLAVTPTVKPTTSTAARTPAPALPAASAPTTSTTAAPVVPTVQPRQPVMMMPSQPHSARRDQPSGAEAPLQPPPALAGKIGLSWSQLADLAHRQPPSRVTIVCDRLLEPVAQQVGKDLDERVQVQSSIVIVPGGQRAQDALVAQVGNQQPELVIDLMASRQASEKAGDVNEYSIWVVNSSLWPDRKSAGSDPAAQRYGLHEFQSLALGSLLRTELGRQFSDQTITYGLAPSYLLRRVNAPSAAMLIPIAKKADSVEPERSERISTAVSNAVVAYIQGMGQVGF